MTQDHILVVDADEKSQRVLEMSLRKAGYSVEVAESGREALEWLEDNSPGLIIAGTTLPDVSGFEFCQRVKDNLDWDRIPFMFLTSARSQEAKMRGLELGVEDYLTKPIYVKEVTTRVKLLMERRGQDLVAEADAEEVRGELEELVILDLLQSIESKHKTGTIEFDHAKARGMIYFSEGNVVDAAIGKLRGLEAVFRLMQWSGGTYKVKYVPTIRRRDRIGMPTADVLLEGMQELDDWDNARKAAPGMDRIYEVNYRALADHLRNLPDEVNAVIRLFDGYRTVESVVDDSTLGGVKTLKVIAKLEARQLISDVTPSADPSAVSDGPAGLNSWLEPDEAKVLAPDTPAQKPPETEAEKVRRRRAERKRRKQGSRKRREARGGSDKKVRDEYAREAQQRKENSVAATVDDDWLEPIAGVGAAEVPAALDDNVGRVAPDLLDPPLTNPAVEHEIARLTEEHKRLTEELERQRATVEEAHDETRRVTDAKTQAEDLARHAALEIAEARERERQAAVRAQAEAEAKAEAERLARVAEQNAALARDRELQALSHATQESEARALREQETALLRSQVEQERDARLEAERRRQASEDAEREAWELVNREREERERLATDKVRATQAEAQRVQAQAQRVQAEAQQARELAQQAREQAEQAQRQAELARQEAERVKAETELAEIRTLAAAATAFDAADDAADGGHLEQLHESAEPLPLPGESREADRMARQEAAAKTAAVTALSEAARKVRRDREHRRTDDLAAVQPKVAPAPTVTPSAPAPAADPPAPRVPSLPPSKAVQASQTSPPKTQGTPAFDRTLEMEVRSASGETPVATPKPKPKAAVKPESSKEASLRAARSTAEVLMAPDAGSDNAADQFFSNNLDEYYEEGPHEGRNRTVLYLFIGIVVLLLVLVGVLVAMNMDSSTGPAKVPDLRGKPTINLPTPDEGVAADTAPDEAPTVPTATVEAVADPGASAADLAREQVRATADRLVAVYSVDPETGEPYKEVDLGEEPVGTDATAGTEAPAAKAPEDKPAVKVNPETPATKPTPTATTLPPDKPERVVDTAVTTMTDAAKKRALKQHIARGKGHVGAQRFDQALTELNKAYAIAPGSFQVNYWMGRAHYGKGNNAGAKKFLERAIRANGNSADTLMYLGFVYQATGQRAKAIDMYKKYLRLRPKGGNSDSIRQILARYGASE